MQTETKNISQNPWHDESRKEQILSSYTPKTSEVCVKEMRQILENATLSTHILIPQDPNQLNSFKFRNRQYMSGLCKHLKNPAETYHSDIVFLLKKEREVWMWELSLEKGMKTMSVDHESIIKNGFTYIPSLVERCDDSEDDAY